MNILNIVNTLFSNSNFMKMLTISFISLIIIFFVILFLAYLDKKKACGHKEKWYKKFQYKKKKDQKNKIKEDVTFEMPVISENLKQYKENIEKAISNDNHYDDIKPIITDMKIKAPKHTKVLDIDEIVDTPVEPTFEMQEVGNVRHDDMEIILPKKRQ